MRVFAFPALPFLVLAFGLPASVWSLADLPVSQPAPQASSHVSGDTVGSKAPPAAVRTAAPADSLPANAKGTAKDSVAAVPKSRSDSVIVVKHSFNHREQIITGSVIMTCLGLMLVAMNNYNPR